MSVSMVVKKDKKKFVTVNGVSVNSDDNRVRNDMAVSVVMT